jgi:hypothetical protein
MKNSMTLKIVTLALVATTLISGCGTEKPKKKAPGTPTEIIGVDESQSGLIRFEAKPSASPKNVISSNLIFRLPIRFNTSSGTPTTHLIKFAIRFAEPISSKPLTRPNEKLVRFEGIVVPTEDASVSDEITALVTKALSFKVACIGKLSTNPNESCMEFVATLIVNDSALSKSLSSLQDKAYYFSYDFNESQSETDLVLNKETTQDMSTLRIKGQDEAVSYILDL